MRFASHALCFLVLFAATPALYAANPCLTGGFPQPRDGTGTGGTGRGPLQEDGSGIGGTGHTPWLSGSTDGNGLGGTGRGPVQEDGTGTGGTGHAPRKQATDGHGTGGTGNTPTPDGNGMGGTGHDTEVEGVITGFASVCVNGLELHYQPSTPVAINGRTGSPKDLAVGQVVRAQAKGVGDQLAISRLQVRHLMVAPLQAIGARRAQAMGQTIEFDEDIRLPADLTRGQKVAISGFVGAGGIIIATRLDAVSADSPDSITGEVSQNGQGHRMVGGVPVDGAGADLKAGASIRAEGRYDNGRLQATRVERDDIPSRAERFVVQGPAREVGASSLNVGNRHFSVDTAAPTKPELPHAGQWVRVEGQRRGHDLLIQKIEVQERILPGHGRQGERLPRNSKSRGARESEPRGERESREHETSERPEHSERTERSETSERTERVEAPERTERIESPERPERIEIPEKPERVESPERVERTERIEPPEKPERAERSEPKEARG